jgi:hypothetical protein
MENGATDIVRKEIIILLSDNYGEKFAEFVEKTYSKEVFPVFTHDCFVVLRDLIGIERAKEAIDKVLVKHNVSTSYE